MVVELPGIILEARGGEVCPPCLPSWWCQLSELEGAGGGGYLGLPVKCSPLFPPFL